MPVFDTSYELSPFPSISSVHVSTSKQVWLSCFRIYVLVTFSSSVIVRLSGVIVFEIATAFTDNSYKAKMYWRHIRDAGQREHVSVPLQTSLSIRSFWSMPWMHLPRSTECINFYYGSFCYTQNVFTSRTKGRSEGKKIEEVIEPMKWANDFLSAIPCNAGNMFKYRQISENFDFFLQIDISLFYQKNSKRFVI